MRANLILLIGVLTGCSADAERAEPAAGANPVFEQQRIDSPAGWTR
ncbi:MAG: hypothetical protein U1E76_16900 [Planctomycetota bacterium]